jgi:hypothetical protein
LMDIKIFIRRRWESDMAGVIYNSNYGFIYSKSRDVLLSEIQGILFYGTGKWKYERYYWKVFTKTCKRKRQENGNYIFSGG